MSSSDFYIEVLKGYIEMVKTGLPIAFTIAACNICFNIIISAFSGGRLRIGRGGE